MREKKDLNILCIASEDYAKGDKERMRRENKYAQ